MKKLLELKKEKKAKQPVFIRSGAYRKPGLKIKWRKPKGLHNKLKDGKKGHGKKVNDGYRTPVLLRGYSSEGKKLVLVHNINELQNLEPEKHDLLIASIGNKKRLILIEEAKKNGFKIMNFDSEKKFKEIKESINVRSKIKTERETKKSNRAVKLQKEAEKKAEKESKKKVEKNSNEADSHKSELKKQQKILTKKE